MKSFRPMTARLLWMSCLMCFLTGCGPQEEPVGEDVNHYLAGKMAMDRGDHDVALQEFNKSIELRPDAWAYFYRAKLHAEAKNDDQAKADCKAGLQLDPSHADLKWLQSELKKRPEQRFKGRNASTPKSQK